MTARCAVNDVATEQIAAGLRRSGFAARVFVDTDGAGTPTRRGVSIHGICVLGWRYPDGRWEYTDRPPRLIEPAADDPAGYWIWDDVFGDCCRPAASVFDPAPMIVSRIAELLPADPNRPRAQCFPDFWAWDRACLDSAEAPGQWYQDWCDHLFTELRPEAARAGYTPRTARLADYMCSPRALTAYRGVGPAVMNDQRAFRLAHDVPLPAPLLDVLRNLTVITDFSTWARIGHTSDPVDWPAVISDLHQYLAWDYEQVGDGDHAARARSQASMEVALRVGPDGRILVSPIAVTTS